MSIDKGVLHSPSLVSLGGGWQIVFCSLYYALLNTGCPKKQGLVFRGQTIESKVGFVFCLWKGKNKHDCYQFHLLPCCYRIINWSSDNEEKFVCPFFFLILHFCRVFHYLVVSFQSLDFELDSAPKSIISDWKIQSIFSSCLGTFHKTEVTDGVDDGDLEGLVSVPHTYHGFSY